eukprot:scaffold12243_cov58-Skeletonema_marinoi.AAC.1
MGKSLIVLIVLSLGSNTHNTLRSRSPGAAKLEMQRRRRFGLYKKVELQQKLLEVLRERGWTDSHFGFFNNNDKKAKNKHITLLAKHEREKVTMNITPGTAYLDRVTEAL